MSALAAGAGVLALVKALEELKNGLKTVIDNYAHFESMQMGLETFFQSASKGKAVFEDLRKLSNETTFGVDELANSFTQLANVGVDVNTINDKLVMLGNLASGDKQKFAELTSIFAKINSTGKVTSMQLQQIASRGIPIYDMLKKMGVQGTATAEDITKAFKEMTSEGGQFYNAMKNINKTIEGKEGFISDYFKEFTVNFAEASGVADIYKGLLDAIKGILGALSDALLKINENPVTKALFSGLFVGSITALVSVIGLSLLPKLKAVIGHLIQVNLLQGWKGWVTLAVAGIAAGAAAIVSYKSKQKELNDEMEETNKKLKERNRLLQQGNYVKYYQDSLSDIDDKIKSATNDYNEILNSIKKINLKPQDLRKQFNNAEKINGQAKINGQLVDENYVDWYERDYAKRYEEPLKNAEKKLEELNKKRQDLEEHLHASEQHADALSILEEVEKRAEEAKETAGLTEAEIELKKKKDELNAQKEALQMELEPLLKDPMAKNVNGNIDIINRLKNAIVELNKELDALGAKKTWQQYWQEVTGVDTRGLTATDDKTIGQVVADKTIKELDANLQLQLNANAYLGGGEEGANEIKKRLQEQIYNYINNFLTTTGLDEDFTINNYSIQALKAFADSLGDFTCEAEKAADDVKKYANVLQRIGEESKESGIKRMASNNSTLNELNSKIKDYKNKIKDLEKESNGKLDEDTKEQIKNYKKYIKDLKEEIDKIKKDDKWKEEHKAAKNEYAEGAMSSYLDAALNGSDIGNFLNTLEETRDPLLAIIDTVIGAFFKVISGIEGFNEVINFVTELMKELTPLFEAMINVLVQPLHALEDIIYSVVTVLTPVIQIWEIVSKTLALPLRLIAVGFALLAKLLEPLTHLFDKVLDWFDMVFDMIDDLIGREKEEEEQQTDLTGAYKDLLEAMKKTEEEYEKRKKELNSQDYASSVTGVHDMILTPQGQFSTDPDDYIIATKNPSGLNNNGNSSVVMLQPVINNSIANSANVEVSTSKDENGITQMIINISKKIASDYANGINGWDNAVSQRTYLEQGKRLSL